MYLYDPNDPTTVDRLKQFEEFCLPVDDLPHVIRYIIYCYDQNSELKSLYPDYLVRKREAAIKAGFVLDLKGRFTKAVEDIIMGQNTSVNHMILRFVRLFNNPAFVISTSYWEMLYKEILTGMRVSDSKILKIVHENITKISDKIQEQEIKMLGGQESEAMRKAIYASMERERLALRPESVAKAISKKSLNLGIETYDEING